MDTDAWSVRESAFRAKPSKTGRSRKVQSEQA